jgi:beta-lactamase class A
MITKSENPASDALMDFIGGPLIVSEDMANLGLENTFIGGYFYDGAPLLQQYSTPANNRIDVFTNPDSYNQTTPSDMGQLLSDIYKCSKTGDGSFTAISPTKFSKTICNDFLTYLKQDRIGVLIEAGLPEGTQIAHKHGWISGADGVIQNISDAGIIFTPNGDYILTIYVYHPVQTVWEPVSGMISKISEVVYNYFNLPK